MEDISPPSPLFCRVEGELTISFLSWLLPDHFHWFLSSKQQGQMAVSTLNPAEPPGRPSFSEKGVATKNRSEVFEVGHYMS